MDLILKRIFKGTDYTIGNLYVNGDKFSDTLEDTDRGLNSTMNLDDIKKIKKAGITAIPTGRYKITLNVQSPKFKHYPQYSFCDGYLPRLISVPGYEGILIHIGNYASDTDGCILVGKNTVKGAVMDSTATFKKLLALMQEADNKKELIYITIE